MPTSGPNTSGAERQPVAVISGGPVKVKNAQPVGTVKFTGGQGPRGFTGPQGPQGTIAISTAEFDGGSAFTVFISAPSLDFGSAA